MVDTEEDEDATYLLYEFCKDGTLEDKIRNGKISEEECLKIFKQLLNACECLQEHNIIHRDIKAENIFIDGDIYKLGDFGFCVKLETQHALTTGYFGSLLYMAPEVAFQQEYNSKCDIWSLGVVLFRMLFNSFPILCETKEEYLDKLRNFSFQATDDLMISQRTKELLQRMLTTDPQTRITWRELFEYGTQLTLPHFNLDKYKFTKAGKLDGRSHKGIDEELRIKIEEEYNARKTREGGIELCAPGGQEKKTQISFKQTKLDQAFLNTNARGNDNQGESNDYVRFEEERNIPKNPDQTTHFANVGTLDGAINNNPNAYAEMLKIL